MSGKRNPAKTEVPILPVVLGSLMSALTGNTGCTEITDAINNCLMNYFREKDLSHLVTSDCSRETVRKILSLVDSESLNSLYTEMISALIKNDFRVVEAEVQAARSTGRTKLDSDSMHGALILMNSDDAIRRVCLCHKLIGKKGTVIPADPDILKKLNPDNAVVLANAMNCRYDFVSTVIGRGAHYCLSLKGNQNRTQDEIRSLFNTTRQEHIITSHPWAERTPGRTDYRVSIIRGTLLSDIILDRWQGLKEGCIVRVERTDFQQSAKKEVLEDRFFISSISPVRENIQRVYEITSMHWSMDHSSLWCLDMRYSQERMQGNDPEYIARCCALNKLATAFLENYRYWLWNCKREKELPDLSMLRERCHDPDVAMECIASSLGFIRNL